MMSYNIKFFVEMQVFQVIVGLGVTVYNLTEVPFSCIGHGSGVQRAHSLTSKDLKTGSVPRESVLAWQEKGYVHEYHQIRRLL